MPRAFNTQQYVLKSDETAAPPFSCCLRTPDRRRRFKLKSDYKKGYEIRISVNTIEELKIVKSSLKKEDITVGNPYKKRQKIILPIYGMENTGKFIRAVSKARKGAKTHIVTDGSDMKISRRFVRVNELRMRKKNKIVPRTCFSINIKTIHKAGNSILFDLANDLGISERQIQFWETGESVPSVPSSIRIARRYGLTLDELFFSKISPDRISGRIRKGNNH